MSNKPDLRITKWLFLIASGISLAAMTNAQDVSLAEKLGYPADAKLLILHADDQLESLDKILK